MSTAPVPSPQQSASGTALLLVFTVALLIGIVPILMVGVFATWVTLVIAVVSVLALAAGIIVFLTRFLGE